MRTGLFVAAALGVGLLATAGCMHLRRDSWQRPDAVMEELAVSLGATVADLGAGDGYFTFRLAEAVGPTGRVLAVDVDDEALAALAAEATARGLANVETVRADLDDAKLPTAEVDLVLVCNTYHHLDDRVAYFTRLQRALAPSGRLVVIELDEVPWYIPIGAHRTPPETIRDELTRSGLRHVRSWTGLEHQSFQVFTRPAG